MVSTGSAITASRCYKNTDIPGIAMGDNKGRRCITIRRFAIAHDARLNRVMMDGLILAGS